MLLVTVMIHNLNVSTSYSRYLKAAEHHYLTDLRPIINATLLNIINQSPTRTSIHKMPFNYSDI